MKVACEGEENQSNNYYLVPDGDFPIKLDPKDIIINRFTCKWFNPDFQIIEYRIVSNIITFLMTIGNFTSHFIMWGFIENDKWSYMVLLTIPSVFWHFIGCHIKKVSLLWSDVEFLYMVTVYVIGFVTFYYLIDDLRIICVACNLIQGIKALHTTCMVPKVERNLGHTIIWGFTIVISVIYWILIVIDGIPNLNDVTVNDKFNIKILTLDSFSLTIMCAIFIIWHSIEDRWNKDGVIRKPFLRYGLKLIKEKELENYISTQMSQVSTQLERIKTRKSMELNSIVNKPNNTLMPNADYIEQYTYLQPQVLPRLIAEKVNEFVSENDHYCNFQFRARLYVLCGPSRMKINEIYWFLMNILQMLILNSNVSSWCSILIIPSILVKLIYLNKGNVAVTKLLFSMYETILCMFLLFMIFVGGVLIFRDERIICVIFTVVNLTFIVFIDAQIYLKIKNGEIEDRSKWYTKVWVTVMCCVVVCLIVGIIGKVGEDDIHNIYFTIGGISTSILNRLILSPLIAFVPFLGKRVVRVIRGCFFISLCTPVYEYYGDEAETGKEKKRIERERKKTVEMYNFNERELNYLSSRALSTNPRSQRSQFSNYEVESNFFN